MVPNLNTNSEHQMTCSPPPSPEIAARHGFQSKLSKEEINRLPLRRCELPIHLISEREHVGAALRKLKRERVLGFDTETRPAFRKGESHMPALLQLATATEVFLFQIKATGLTPGLATLLADTERIKVGVGLDHEIATLKKLGDFEPAGFEELGPLADQVGVEANGLRSLAACVLGIRISKSAQRSNWARAQLTQEQIRYAATDAWVSREIHQRLMVAINSSQAN
jgi:ribonuclease D